MASHTLNPTVWSLLCELACSLATKHNVTQDFGSDPEVSNLDRDLVKEALWKSPHSFSSDYDVQVMMDMYSGRI